MLTTIRDLDIRVFASEICECSALSSEWVRSYFSIFVPVRRMTAFICRQRRQDRSQAGGMRVAARLIGTDVLPR